MEKKEIRKQALKARDNLTLEYRSAADDKIYQKLISMECYQNSELLMVYINYKSEVNTKRLIEKAWKDKKRVAVPKVLSTNGEMEFFEISSLNETVKGYMGIEEPDITEKEPVNIKTSGIKTLMVMPGAAFDSECSRIGYGGGFYDRYLKKYSCDCLDTIAVCYAIQIVQSIPGELFDRKPHGVLTEKEYFTIKRK